MDLIAAKLGANMAKSELLASGQIGGGENKVIAYDGTGEKMDILGNGETYAKASSEFVNGNNISKIVRAVAGNDGEIVGEIVYTKDELSIEVTDIATMVSYNDTLLLISAAADIEGYLEKGTYVSDLVTGVEGDMAHTWISSIEYGEVKPIDPKYLPGVPHFDLAAMGMPAVEVNGVVQQLAIDTAAIQEAMRGGEISLTFLFNMGGSEIEVTGTFMCFGSAAAGMYQANTFFTYGSAVFISVTVGDGTIEISAMQ